MDIDGARMRYLRAGSGPALILLHGLLAYSFSWRFTMPALAPYATVYAPDLLGAGFSDRPRGLDHSMRATAQTRSGICRKSGTGIVRLAGNVARWGRGNGRSCGMHEPGRLQCAPAPAWCWYVRSIHTLHMELGWRLFLRQASARRCFVPGLDKCRFSFHIFTGASTPNRKTIPPGSLEGYTAPMAIPGLLEHALSIVRTWTADLRELEMLLPKLAPIPTLLMWGSKDPAVYVSSMEPLARHFEHVAKGSLSWRGTPALRRVSRRVQPASSLSF